MGKGQVVNLRQINGVAKSMINRRHRPDTAATTSQKLAADVLPQLLISQCGTRIKSDSALVQPGHLRWQRCPLFDQHKGTVTDVVQQPGICTVSCAQVHRWTAAVKPAARTAA